MIAPAIALPAPKDRPAAQPVSPPPVKGLDLRIGAIDPLCPAVYHFLFCTPGPGDIRMLLPLLLCHLAAMRELPGIEIRCLIIYDVPVVGAAFEHERLEPFLRELFRRPASADTGTDHDRLIC